MDEVLKYAIENGIIDLSRIQEEIEMTKREELLKKHPYSIWKSKDGKWHTYLPDEGKRVPRKRKTKKELEDLIVEYWKQQEENPKISEVFEKWLENKLEFEEIKKGSADRYETDFIRFFEKSGFADRRIKTITEDDLEAFVKKQIIENKLTPITYSGLRLIVRGIFKFAKKRKWTTISISTFFNDLELSKNSFTKKVVEMDKQVFNEDELPRLCEYLKERGTIRDLGVLLLLETGIRVGELAALKRSDWDGDVLKIRRTETRYKDENKKTVIGVQDFPKTDAGFRDVILTEKGIETLNRIVELNPHTEYLLQSERGMRTRGNTFNKRLEGALTDLGMPLRSTHKGRRTYITTLIDAGCDDAVVTKQAGHKSIDTSRKYYYYSNKTAAHQKEQVQKAIKI